MWHMHSPLIIKNPIVLQTNIKINDLCMILKTERHLKCI